MSSERATPTRVRHSDKNKPQYKNKQNTNTHLARAPLLRGRCAIDGGGELRPRGAQRALELRGALPHRPPLPRRLLQRALQLERLRSRRLHLPQRRRQRLAVRTVVRVPVAPRRRRRRRRRRSGSRLGE